MVRTDENAGFETPLKDDEFVGRVIRLRQKYD